ncbi:phosphotransferase [Pseudomonas sp. MPC6]|uniref:phosphotransferase enzyme family protein n=1 Tax=unclassified Pseudomonas TaxID=196821 RepID=UPI0011107D15|nr:phosphotransferase [Pseudomonas sp. MPC6]QCY09460.1 aminoglycoside phosphotransferase [Pseudomonas sp. MPC6]
MDKVLTLASPQQARHFQELAREALKYWGIDDAAISLTKHRENAVFSVIDASSQRRYALRVHRFGYHSDAALHSELLWMRALNQAGVCTPPIIPTIDGELFKNVAIDTIPRPHQCDLLGWVEGAPLGSIDNDHDFDPAQQVESYRVVGELAGRLHNQSEDWQRPPSFIRDAWDADGLVGDNPIWGRFCELEPLFDAQRVLLCLARDIAKQKLKAFGQSPDRYGLIHNDFLPENLLMTADGIRIIDFDDAGFGWHLFEFATSLFFHIGEDNFDDILASMIECYRYVRELPQAHLAMLPTFFLVRGLVYLGWVHTRKDTETAKALTADLIDRVVALADAYLAGRP